MKIITFEEKDARALLKSLELERMKIRDEPKGLSTVDEMHRKFHYHVVSWLQDQGADCIR